MQYTSILALLAAAQGAMATRTLEKRFIELEITSVTTPNGLFPYDFPWQHQNNAYLQASAKTGLLLKNPKASAALRDLQFAAHYAPDFFITNATMIPPSGDKKDFLSYAPYWWPNATCPDTCAWIQKDGIINPDILSLTQQSDLTAMTNSMRTSTLTEYYFGPSWWGANAVAQQLKTWFINPATRMNPNVNYGQIIRKANHSEEIGRFEGILSVRQLAFVPAAIEMVRAKASDWTRAHDAAIVQWSTDYLNWLLNPPFKPATKTGKNNHRTYWSCQVVEFQRLLGQHDAATATLDTFVKTYMPGQIDSIGNQTIEFTRTRPVHYAMFNIDALIYLAQFAEQIRPDTGRPYYDFWGAQDQAVRKTLDFVIKYYTLDDVEIQDIDALIRMCRIMVAKYGDPTGAYTSFIQGLGDYHSSPYSLSPLFYAPS